MDKQPESKFNIDKLPAPHVISLVLTDDDFLNYSRGISVMEGLCTMGGIWVHNRKATYEDPILPFFIVHVSTPYFGGLARASYVIRKKNLYILAFTERGVWKQFRNCGYNFSYGNDNKEFECARFPCNYQESGGLQIRELGLKIFKESIVMLHLGVGDVSNDVHVSCVHLSEAIRFRCYNFLICGAVVYCGDVFTISKEEIPENRRDIVYYWEDLSGCYKNHFSSEVEKLPKHLKSMMELLELTCVENIEEILSVVLLCERDIPEERRLRGSVNPKNLVVKRWDGESGRLSRSALILQRINFWKNRTGVWRTLRDIVQVAHSDKRIAALIIANADLRLMNKNMSFFKDRDNVEYHLPDFVLLDPVNW